MEARVTAQSQSYRLRERMQEAKVSHGQEIRADLPNVRVLALAGGTEAQTLFCNMGPIRVRAILNRGDEGPLPTDVTLEGLQVSTSGVYDILNALVGSNGRTVFTLRPGETVPESVVTHSPQSKRRN